jgi:hypothetical protein
MSLPAQVVRTHQRCGASTLILELPDGRRINLKPTNGTSYKIEQDGKGKYRLQQ